MAENRSVLTRAAAPPQQRLAYGNDAEHIADIRFGGAGAANAPLVILVHGGFWRPAFDRTHAEPMAAAIARSGWTVANIEYRRIPGNPDITLQDVKLAIEQLPLLVSQHDGTAILIGHSAGGHLVLWAASQCVGPSLKAVLALAPVADLQLAHELGLDSDAVLAFLGVEPAQRTDIDPCCMAAPATAVTIIQGAEDSIVPAAVSAAFVAKHPGIRWVRLPDCDHFAVIDPLSHAWPRVMEELRDLSRRGDANSCVDAG